MLNKEKTPIGEFIEMKYGKMPPTEVLSDEGFPISSGYRITGYAKEFLYEETMLILVARGVGGTGDVKISPPNSWITNLSIILNVNKEKADKKFLFYKLSNEPLKDNLNTGAAQAQITIDVFSKYKIYLPPIETQKRISEILSAYDDLIENNLKRIRLLEESARLLYREWFVRLKFPNHEHTPLIDGLPEGWSKVSVSDLGEVITGKTPSTTVENNYGDDFPFVKTPDMHGNIFVVKTESSLTEQGANTQRNKYLPKGTIMVSCIGTVGVVSLASTVCQTNQQINSVIPKSKEYQFYSFFALQDLKPIMEAIGGGATMNNVNKSKFESLDVLLPSESLLKNFDEIVSPIFEQILNLLNQNQKLKQARDLLLPRLMSGEIAV